MLLHDTAVAFVLTTAEPEVSAAIVCGPGPHAPATHAAPTSQTLPQWPQWSPSVSRSVSHWFAEGFTQLA
jgi:hypothetical protein